MPPESGRERDLLGTDVDETRGFLAPRPSQNGVFSDLLRRKFRGRPAYTPWIIGRFGEARETAEGNVALLHILSASSIRFACRLAV